MLLSKHSVVIFLFSPPAVDVSWKDWRLATMGDLDFTTTITARHRR
jgi:hypothetical protein